MNKSTIEVQVKEETGQIVYRVPKDLAIKCPSCKAILWQRDWIRNLKVCSNCSYHFRLTAYERIELLVDRQSFYETESDLISTDHLQFSSQTQVYSEKLTSE